MQAVGSMLKLLNYAIYHDNNHFLRRFNIYSHMWASNTRGKKKKKRQLREEIDNSGITMEILIFPLSVFIELDRKSAGIQIYEQHYPPT